MRKKYLYMAATLSVSVPLLLGFQNVGYANSWQYDAGDTAVLNILWRVWNGSDGATTITPAERDAMPSDGAVFYVPRYPYDSNNPLYRLVLGNDHMESLIEGEAGYQTEFSLGYPLPNKTIWPGLTQLVRSYNSANGDHVLQGDSENLAGYTKENLNVYGWPRYNNVAESMITLNAGGVSLEANRVAGCALWRWTWNGKQLVNNGTDYGRQMQTSIAWVDSTGNTPNPTEAGDRYTGYQLPPSARHGAPCISGNVSGSTLKTETVPLEWNGGSLIGSQGGPDNPVIWKNLKIGKDVELNYQNMGAVALYTTHATLARPLTAGSVEIPTAYLSPELKSLYTYEGKGDVLTSVIVPASLETGKKFVPTSGIGGIIAATPTGNYALGFFGVNTKQGGSVSEFGMYIFIILNNGDLSEQSNDTIKLGADYKGPMKAGVNHYRTMVISGTLADVRAKMKSLYSLAISQGNSPGLPAYLYDANTYLAMNPDLSKQVGTSVTAANYHWNTLGLAVEGRRASYEFDVQYYLNLYQDLRTAFSNTGYSSAINHYKDFGVNEGRRASLEFDVQYYVKQYPDLAAAFKTSTGYNYKAASDHFINYGLKEGRRGSADFDAKAYLNRYPDLKTKFGGNGYAAAFVHWVTIGKAEGKIGTP